MVKKNVQDAFLIVEIRDDCDDETAAVDFPHCCICAVDLSFFVIAGDFD